MIQQSIFVYYKADIIIISLNVTCSRHDIAEKLLRVKHQSPN